MAPASANVIGKLAHGIADDMLTTTFMACTCPKIVSPAMNTRMYENEILQDNLKGSGVLSHPGHPSGDGGIWPAAIQGRERCRSRTPSGIHPMRPCSQRLKGKENSCYRRPTREAIDPVRYITNHSTGKMGYAIAEAAAYRGADVTLVTGPVSIKAPLFVKTIPAESAKQMYEAVTGAAKEQDIIIKAAAVADYRPAHQAEDKIKKIRRRHED